MDIGCFFFFGDFVGVEPDNVFGAVDGMDDIECHIVCDNFV